MKKTISVLGSALAAALLLISTGCQKKASLEMNFADKYEGKEVELISFEDSVTVARAMVKDGKASFQLPDSLPLPLLTLLTIDGRTRAYYVAESGKAELRDSMRVATGTPLNERLGTLMARLDSVENIDDLTLYTDYAEKLYNENSDTPFGNYFGLEWMMYAAPERVDSMLAKHPDLAKMPRAQKYIKFAKLRKATAPGNKYIDLEGEDANGRKITLSQYIQPGKYTLVDFWASWCPYCIKEIPELKELYSSMKDKGVEIVGVAVRDSVDDTKASIAKHGIEWPVVFNTERRPYDIYGFSGIPHHILIGPDGNIIARGESAKQTKDRLEKLLSENKGN